MEVNKLIKLVGLQYYLSEEQIEEFFKSVNHRGQVHRP